MQTQQIDIETLLVPISGTHPAGENLRYAEVYRTLEEACQEADDLPQGKWVTACKPINWAEVRETAAEVLSTQSKDLQIAVWFAKAHLKQDGFSGLGDSLRLLSELLQRFWPELYPEMQDGKPRLRYDLLEDTCEDLAHLLKQLPMTTTEPAYSWHHWQAARELSQLQQQDAKAAAAEIKKGKVSSEQFDQAADRTLQKYYETLWQALEASQQAYAQFETVVHGCFGSDAPPLHTLKTAIDDCHSLVVSLLRHKGGLQPQPLTDQTASSQAVQEETSPQPVRAPQLSNGAASDPNSREHAVQLLERAAQYFRQHEPLSPVPYPIEQAIRWAGLSFQEWCDQEIKDEKARTHLYEKLGVKNAPKDQ